MNSIAAFERWNEVLKLISEFHGKAIVDSYLRKINAVEYSEETETLTIYVNLFQQMVIEDDRNEVISDAVKHVFGENTRLEVKSESEYEKKKAQEKPEYAVKEPDPLYHSKRYISIYEEMERIREMIREKPQVFLGERKYKELFFRVIANFINCYEFIGLSRHIKVTRRADRIEIHDYDGLGINVRALNTELKLFERSDYFSYVIPQYRKSNRYSPCPFYLSGNTGFEFPKSYYINTDLNLTMFMLVCLSPYVDIESVVDGKSERLCYRDGKSLWEYADVDKTEKVNGAYLTFDAPWGLENEDICHMLDTAALFARGLRFSFTDEENGIEQSFFYEKAEDFLLSRHSFALPCFGSSIKALGQDRYNELHYNVNATLTFGFTDSDPTARTYYNFSLLEEDNPFAEMLCGELARRINAFPKAKLTLDGDDVKRGIAFVLDIRTDGDCTSWTAERACVPKKQLINDVIEDLTAKACRGLQDYSYAEIAEGLIDVFLDRVFQEIAEAIEKIEKEEQQS